MSDHLDLNSSPDTYFGLMTSLSTASVPSSLKWGCQLLYLKCFIRMKWLLAHGYQMFPGECNFFLYPIPKLIQNISNLWVLCFVTQIPHSELKSVSQSFEILGWGQREEQPCPLTLTGTNQEGPSQLQTPRRISSAESLCLQPSSIPSSAQTCFLPSSNSDDPKSFP